MTKEKKLNLNENKMEAPGYDTKLNDEKLLSEPFNSLFTNLS